MDLIEMTFVAFYVIRKSDPSVHVFVIVMPTIDKNTRKKKKNATRVQTFNARTMPKNDVRPFGRFRFSIINVINCHAIIFIIAYRSCALEGACEHFKISIKKIKRIFYRGY